MRAFLRKASRGFTLVQLAIALAIGGLALVAVWNGAQQAWQHTQVYNAERQLVQLVESIRTALMSTSTVAGGPGTVQGDYTGTNAADLIQKVASMNVIPGEMRTSVGTTIMNSPWHTAGSATLSDSPVGVAASNGTTIGSTGRSFAVRYQRTPTFHCIQFISRLTRTIDDMKMNRILVNGTALTLPITVADLTTRCQSSDNNTIEFEFSLRN